MKKKFNKKWLIGFAIVWVIGVVGMALFPDDKIPKTQDNIVKDTFDETIKKVNKDVLVEVKNNSIILENNFGNVDADLEVKAALSDITKILDKIIEYKEFEESEIIIFDFKAEFKDKYNKIEKNSAFKIAFNTSELKKVDTFKDISYEQLISLKSGNLYIAPAINEKLEAKTIDMLREK